MNNAATKIHAQVLCECIFSSLGYIPRCGIARSHGNSMCNFLRKDSVLFSFSFFLPAHGNVVSPPGIEPMPPALEAENLNHWTTREAPDLPCFTVALRLGETEPDGTNAFGLLRKSFFPEDNAKV